MKINAETWHCRVFAWTWNFWHYNAPVPENTNLCQYFRYITIFAVGTAMTCALVYTILLPLFYMAGLCKAFFLTIVFNWSHPQDMTIAGLFGNLDEKTPMPYISNTRRKGWGLWIPITIGLIIWLIGNHAKNIGYGILAIIGIVLAVFIIYGIKKGFSAWRDSDSLKLFKTYLKARKEKVCPLITIEGLPKSSTTEPGTEISPT